MISTIVSILVGAFIGGLLGAAVAIWVIGKIERREWR
jgi:ethanolamine transporter EutH